MHICRQLADHAQPPVTQVYFFSTPLGMLETVTEADYTSFLSANFAPAAAVVAQKYPITAFESTPSPAFFAIETVFTDSSFKCPVYRGLKPMGT